MFMKITMADVAAAAGVNKATVSRVLRGDARISQATSEKVWAAVKRLGYRPDAVARGLSSRTNDLIGVVFGDLASPWTGAFLSGLERVLGRLGLDCIVKEAGSEVSRQSHAIQRLVSRRVDGLILLDCKKQYEVDVPVVSVGSYNPGSTNVSVDMEAAAQALKALAAGREIIYREGDGALFTGLDGLLGVEVKKARGILHVMDGMPREENTTSFREPCDDYVISGSRKEALFCGFWVLEYPAFEMGVLAARILVNGIRGKGVRPHDVFLVPSLFSPEGDLFIPSSCEWKEYPSAGPARFPRGPHQGR